MRGRKPTPTHLKILHGNPGKRPLNDDEPQPDRGIPSCPKHLDANAKKEWRRITKHLDAIGLMTHLDMAALAAYCQSFSRWVKLEEIVQRTGEVLIDVDPDTKKPTGVLRPNPYLGALNKALRNMMACLSEFGLTPSSRTRLRGPQGGDGKDGLDEFARKRG